MANLSSFSNVVDTEAVIPGVGGHAGKYLSTDGSTMSWSAIVQGVTTYDTAGDLPLTGVDEGTMAYVSGNTRVYFWNGSGWYSIALVNTAPTITTGADDEYELAIDGTATVITLEANDPDGVSLTWSYSVTSGSIGSTATVSQSANVFTITPSTNEADAGEFSLTFTASDGINTAASTAAFTLAFIVTVENSAYTTALITGAGVDGNQSILDSSSNNNALTITGNALAQTYSPYRSGGYSYYFDGNGDYLTTGDIAALDFTGDFTIEFWMYRLGNGTGGAATSYESLIGGNGNNSNGWNVYSDSNGNGAIRFYGGSSFIAQTSTGAVSNNVWSHVAITRSGTSLKIFVDGVTSATASSSGTYSQSTANSTVIAADHSGNRHFYGYLSDIRIVSGTAVYTSDFTPPTERLEAVTNTALLTCHLPYFKDGSTSNHTMTVYGDVSAKPFSPYDYVGYAVGTHGGSIYFDGNADWIDLGSGHVTTGDFTIEFWARAAVQVGDYWVDLNGTNRLSLFYDNGDQGGGPDQSFNAYDTDYRGSPGSLSKIAGSWNHVAWVRSSGTITQYTNGVSKYSWSNSLDYTNSTIRIGSDSRSFGHYVQGNMADFRIVNGTAVYTSNFTPPTEPLSAITNTSILISGTGVGIIDKSQTSNLTLNGGVIGSTTQTKYGTSVYFDGSDDSIYLDAEVGNFGTGDFTIEMWVYPTEESNAIFRKTDYAGSSPVPSVAAYVAGSTPLIAVNDGSSTGSYVTATSSISLNTWSHLAITRASGTVTIWINGTSSGTGTSTANVNNSTAFRIGEWRNSSENFKGYLEDFRVTKGLARYTSSFTPPTASLEG